MSSSAAIDMVVHEIEKNRKYKHPGVSPNYNFFLYGDTIRGSFSLNLGDNRPLQHKGVTITLVGRYRNKENNTKTIFFSKMLELLPEATLPVSIECPFSFYRVPFPFPSYKGRSVNIEYFIQAAVEGPGLYKTIPIFFVKPARITPTPFHKGIGISNLLHMDIFLDSTTVDPRKVLLGCVYFALSKIRIVSISLDLLKKEVFYNEGIIEKKEMTVKSFEILDGVPVRGTTVPFRLFLGDCNIWHLPYSNGCLVSTEYFLKVLAIDENEGHYVKNLPLHFITEQ